MIGKIHSVETFGTVDGPGVRFVVFFQGCPMRCKYCHNPDSWLTSDGSEVDSGELIDRMLRNRAFYRTGGLTATGGEPLMQLDFLTDLFERAAAEGIHTALDSSGICYDPARRNDYDRLMRATDLVMLDIKHTDPEEHRKLTGQSDASILAFENYLTEIGKPVWIRHVVVPGITDSKEELEAVGRRMRSHPNEEKLEILPYHLLGKAKYRRLGIDYPLEGVPAFPKDRAGEAYRIVERVWKGASESDVL